MLPSVSSQMTPGSLPRGPICDWCACLVSRLNLVAVDQGRILNLDSVVPVPPPSHASSRQPADGLPPSRSRPSTCSAKRCWSPARHSGIPGFATAITNAPLGPHKQQSPSTPPLGPPQRDPQLDHPTIHFPTPSPLPSPAPTPPLPHPRSRAAEGLAHPRLPPPPPSPGPFTHSRKQSSYRSLYCLPIDSQQRRPVFHQAQQHRVQNLPQRP